jgi:hypothetical protein
MLLNRRILYVFALLLLVALDLVCSSIPAHAQVLPTCEIKVVQNADNPPNVVDFEVTFSGSPNFWVNYNDGSPIQGLYGEQSPAIVSHAYFPDREEGSSVYFPQLWWQVKGTAWYCGGPDLKLEVKAGELLFLPELSSSSK